MRPAPCRRHCACEAERGSGWRAGAGAPDGRRGSLAEGNTSAGILCQRQGLSGPPWYTTRDRQAAIVSISAIAGLEPSVLATGRGLPLAGPGTVAAVRVVAERAGAR